MSSILPARELNNALPLFRIPTEVLTDIALSYMTLVREHGFPSLHASSASSTLREIFAFTHVYVNFSLFGKSNIDIRSLVPGVAV